MSNSEQAPIRIEAITAIGSRRATEDVQAVIHAAGDSNPALSSAAFAVLRDIAPPDQLLAVITLTLSLPADSRDAAVDAATEIARRGTSTSQSSEPLVLALRNAKKPADRLTLLTILDQVGGPPALEALKTAVLDPVPAVSQGALSLIAAWPTDEPPGSASSHCAYI